MVELRSYPTISVRHHEGSLEGLKKRRSIHDAVCTNTRVCLINNRVSLKISSGRHCLPCERRFSLSSLRCWYNWLKHSIRLLILLLPPSPAIRLPHNTSQRRCMPVVWNCSEALHNVHKSRDTSLFIQHLSKRRKEASEENRVSRRAVTAVPQRAFRERTYRMIVGRGSLRV